MLSAGHIPFEVRSVDLNPWVADDYSWNLADCSLKKEAPHNQNENFGLRPNGAD